MPLTFTATYIPVAATYKEAVPDDAVFLMSWGIKSSETLQDQADSFLRDGIDVLHPSMWDSLEEVFRQDDANFAAARYALQDMVAMNLDQIVADEAFIDRRSDPEQPAALSAYLTWTNTDTRNVATTQADWLGAPIELYVYQGNHYLSVIGVASLLQKDITHLRKWLSDNDQPLHRFCSRGREVQALTIDTMLAFVQYERQNDSPAASRVIQAGFCYYLDQVTTDQDSGVIELGGIPIRFQREADGDLMLCFDDLAEGLGITTEQLVDTYLRYLP